MRMKYKKEISVTLALTTLIAILTIYNSQDKVIQLQHRQKENVQKHSENTERFIQHEQQKTTKMISPSDILVISAVTQYSDEMLTFETTTSSQLELENLEEISDTIDESEITDKTSKSNTVINEVKDPNPTTPNTKGSVPTISPATTAEIQQSTSTWTSDEPSRLPLYKWSEKDITDWIESFNRSMREVDEKRQHIYISCIKELKPKECFLKNNLFWPNSTNIRKHSAYKGEPGKDASCADSKKLVILHSYERTGSCYFGSLMKDNPGVFYLFEPYRLQEQIFHKMQYPRSTHLSSAIIQEEAKTLTDYKTCTLKDILAFADPILKEGNVNFYLSYNIHDFLECIMLYHSGRHPANLTRLEHLDQCYEIATEACKNETRTQILLTKTVRGTMEGIAAFLANQECTNNIKVIQLVRDPRAMFNSRYKANWSGLKKLDIKALTSEVEQMCSRMLKDILMRKELEKIYPNMFMKLRYEELTKYTERTMIDVYNFIEENLDFNSLMNIIAYSKNPNSTTQPYKWREYTIMFALTKIIDEYCYPLYVETGYLPVTENVVNRHLTWEDAYGLVVQDENVDKMFANSL